MPFQYVQRFLILVHLLALFTACGDDPADWRLPPESVPATTAVPATPAAAIAALMESTIRDQQLVGLQVSIARTNGEIWSLSAGTADLGRKETLSSEHLFRIGSLTKTFTATIIMRLVQEGRLSLDAPVSTWIRGYPGLERVTIRNLLGHTSGIQNVFSIPDVFVNSTLFPDKFWSHKWLAMECCESGPEFQPGTRTAYSNTNYILLGIIIETVTGRRMAEHYHELAEGVWFVPYETRPASLVSGHVDHFVTMERWYEHKPDTKSWATAGFTAGALASSAKAIVRFGQRLFSSEIIPEDQLNQMRSFRERYGLGFIRYETGGYSLYGHEGELTGFTAVMLFDEPSGLILAACCNTTPFDSVALLGQIRRLLP